MSGEPKDPGFTIVDKRAGASAEGSEAEAEPGRELPKVDFQSFCLSLATSALYHLGVMTHPETGAAATEKNLPLAQQTIDALEMLRDKTSGNLDAEESKLLESLLYELHLRYVEAGRSGEGKPGAE